MKEQLKNNKMDIKNEYYELGWFSTKIKTVEINSLEDICDWIGAMCELAKNGSKRQIWGAKKKDDRGMLGILKVCKDNNFENLKILPHGMFDCVALKNLLSKINECVKKTNRGRTKSTGFTNTLNNCTDFIIDKCATIRYAGDALQCFVRRLEIPKVGDDPMYNLGAFVYNFSDPASNLNINGYKKYAASTNEFFENVIKDKKIKVGIKPEAGDWLEFAQKKMSCLCTNQNYWIVEEILGNPLAKNLQENCKKIRDGLKEGKITLVNVKRKKDIEDDEDDEYELE